MRVDVKSNNGDFYIIFGYVNNGFTFRVYDKETSERLEVYELSCEEQELFFEEVNKFIRESF